MLPAAEIRRVVEQMRNDIRTEIQTTNSLLAQILQQLKRNNGGKD